MSALVFREFSVVLPRCHSPAQLRELAACARKFCWNVVPSDIRGRGECRVPAAPAASCAKCSKAHECRRHGRTGTPGIPARNGFNGLLRALPGDRAFLSPSSAGMVLSKPGRADLTSADLTPASRRQDHTILPSAKASFVSTPFDRSQAEARP